MEEEEKQMQFNPPVYIQRYIAVIDILKSEKWVNHIHKVVDMGCSTLKLVQRLRQVANIEHIYAVDVDRQLLERCAPNAAPLLYHYINGAFDHPLVVDVYAGSVSEYDERLADVDAFIGIELIEHLHNDVLEKLPETVFGCMKPKLAIFTTPNADFNVLFETTGFRHFDHKFEWSRMEFEDWAHSVVTAYSDYSVTFEGIGNGPAGTEHLGACSQMAIFSRCTEKPLVLSANYEGPKPYTLIKSYTYPYKENNCSDDFELTTSLKLGIQSAAFHLRDQIDDETKVISISYLQAFVKCGTASEEVIREKLLELGHEIDANGQVIIKSLDNDVSDVESEENMASDCDEAELSTNCSASDEVEVW